MIPTQTVKPTSDPKELGGRAALFHPTPPCPYPEGPDAALWADGVLEGRRALMWNTKCNVALGTATRWATETISVQAAVPMAKMVFPLGIAACCFFRIGFVLATHARCFPDLGIDDTCLFAHVVQKAMEGMPLDQIIDAENVTWLHKLAFLVAADFAMSQLGGYIPPLDIDRPSYQGECETARLVPWMGGTDEYDFIPAVG
jgi:hypothetical protein